MKDTEVLVVTREGIAVVYKRSEFLVKFSAYGVTFVPRPGHECGWTQRVYPWGTIGLVQEKGVK